MRKNFKLNLVLVLVLVLKSKALRYYVISSFLKFRARLLRGRLALFQH